MKLDMDMIDRKKNHELYEEWENFVFKGIKPSNQIRDFIAESWARSVENHVNPQHNDPIYISEEEFERKRKESDAFIRSAVPYMENLYDSFKGSGCTVIVADKSCCVLEVIGDKEDLEKIEVHNKKALCKEVYIGTNGIGTTIYLDRPIQILGAEHFALENHPLSCSAAPVHDREGNLIGCLSISCVLADANPHILSMVTAAAGAIERQMIIESELAEKQDLIIQREKAFQSISEGIIILDKNMKIISINEKALKLMELDMGKNYIHKDVREYLLEDMNLEKLIHSKKDTIDQEQRLRLHSGNILNCILSISIIWNEENIKGFIIILKEMEKVHELVNKMLRSTAYYSFEDITFQSQVMKEAIHIGKIAADSSSNVLIVGESGTGKELMAHSIHSASKRKNKPFIAINCGAIPSGLIESELFGYEGGAFTGSKKEGNPGKFELANGGTIFLDEIGDMPLEVQASLLRVLQTKEVYRIGGRNPKKIDVRIIAATHRNLENMVSENSFRLDLYYRINVLNIYIPPLRERKEDIEILIEAFIKEFNKKLNKKIKGLDENTKKLLNAYDWVGNVRELSNVFERAINICEEDYIQDKDLPDKILCNVKVEKYNYDQVIENNEKEFIITILKKNNGNIKKSAQKLGFSRSKMYRKLKSLNIDWENYRK
ncbi:MAG: sigma-54-dependent Fis family transcriptional regulator [Anaeromicrobium sp.]|jgi:transcriptional regulator of acetoin/glycerol metabolism|uniref:sigma-54-dependent Fis family transcriptional regulator n=1 Tax=Anaeromicrobium sp. TaxID=1929132 RepID=UPI0025F540AD|nr:sigma-54-dependent Fis family transcriptional regulator [Anaeromicrobium sp.]MCT4596097.1 sigma-54-dependent Fis family transcriptional regulator [Anaeromicrobium sp.]